MLLRWQVSPSPPWGLTSDALINSLCLAKWGLETHLLPERPSNNWGRFGDLYLKLCGDLAYGRNWCNCFISSLEAHRVTSLHKGGARLKK